MKITKPNCRKNHKLLACAVIVSAAFFGGCAVVGGGQEALKTVWGSSTRQLEKARDKAISKTYDKNYWDVFKAAVRAVNKKEYVIFKRDEVRGYMVLMGIHGSVNTTEVGMFFVELGEGQTKVEFSSLSTNAKRIASKNLFHLMDIEFGLAPPDPEPAAPAPKQP